MANQDEKPAEKPPETEIQTEKTSAEPPEHAKADKTGWHARWHRLREWYVSHKKISIPLTFLALMILLAAVPLTRYAIAGTVVKKDLSLRVVDATAHTPVSEARVNAGGISGQTDGEGRVTLRGVKVGKYAVSIAKQHYRNKQVNITVPVIKSQSSAEISFEATGRQVKVVVTNVISKENLKGAEIVAGDVKASTDGQGSATIVLPVGDDKRQATLKLAGYNEATVEIQASQTEIKENKFQLSPAGKIYFLSKKSGRIDVVRTNLDGSDRKTVLAGTGKEEDHNTVLLASRDWKYLALLARRDSDTPKLYLIETESDKLSVIDEGNVNFSLLGWSDGHFVYDIDRISTQQWQASKYALKSFNAATKKITLLDQSRAAGTNQYNAVYESYDNYYLIDDSILYWEQWRSNDYYDSNKYLNKQATLQLIKNDGSDHKVIKSFDYPAGDDSDLYLSSVLYEPREVYLELYENGTPKYLEYTAGKLTEDAKIKEDFIQYTQQEPKTFLLSPNGKENLWTESRDGKNHLLIGGLDANNEKELGTVSDEYKVYGWFSDNYLLVSKKSSEIYILPRSGIKSDADAVKITDYHKPSANYYSYGGGYGGI